MAEYLIQDTTLDAIADAINAKTGGSSAMTPAQMVTEIAAIPSGGRTLLADYTASEDVSAIQIDFTEAMQGYDLYEILFTGTFNKQPFPYAGVNTATNTRYLNKFNTNNWIFFISKVGNAYAAVISNSTQYPISELQYIHTRAYVADAVFQAGFNIKIWGYTA